MNDDFVSHFNPNLMTPRALESVFVQRRQLAERTVELIRDSALTEAKHHSMFIGPRGFGKTHLMSLIYHRVRAMDDLDEHLVIAWLREEEWGVATLLDLFLRIIRTIVEEYPEQELEEGIEEIYELSVAQAEKAAGDLLKQWMADRTMLLLIENLDELFDGLKPKGQKKLRSYIQENPFFTVISSSPSLFNGISLQSSPFYGFFRINHLEPLTLDEAIELVTNSARLRRDQELVNFLQTPAGKARIRAVHHLANGNHRIYMIFSQFLTRESLDALVEPFLRTMDDLTPYYQSRMALLTPQQRKVVEFLCDARGAVVVKDIAKRCFMTHQTTSSQLGKLRDKGYVVSQQFGRDSFHELREPLMRLCIEVKKHRSEPVRLFVDFLRLWYTPEDLESRLGELDPDASLERLYVESALDRAGDGYDDPRVKACVEDFEREKEGGRWDEALIIADELLAVVGCRHWQPFESRAMALLNLGRYEEAIADLSTALELDNPNEINSLLLFAKSLLMYKVGKSLEAMQLMGEARLAAPDFVPLMKEASFFYLRTNHVSEAKEATADWVEKEPENEEAWVARGDALLASVDFYGACEAAKTGVDLNNGSSVNWLRYSVALMMISDLDGSLDAVNRAINLDKESYEPWWWRAQHYAMKGEWGMALKDLNSAMVFRGKLNSDAPELSVFIAAIFRSGNDRVEWTARIEEFTSLVLKYDSHAILGRSLLYMIGIFKIHNTHISVVREWTDTWSQLLHSEPELALPLKLMDVYVRYQESGDERTLLELASEERAILTEAMDSEQLSLMAKVAEKQQERLNS